jgi:hypothetical protein
LWCEEEEQEEEEEEESPIHVPMPASEKPRSCENGRGVMILEAKLLFPILSRSGVSTALFFATSKFELDAEKKSGRRVLAPSREGYRKSHAIQKETKQNGVV